MPVKADPYIRTYSGVKFYPLDPEPDDINIDDVTHHLSNICRFTGATSEFYSVAQHSILVSEVLDGTGHEMWGLLHDASEAYLLDLAGPLKRQQEFAAYREVEEVVMDAVCIAFGLEIPQPDEVHAADMVLLATEKRDLMKDDDLWHDLEGVMPLDNRIIPWTPLKARRAFRERYSLLRHRERRLAMERERERGDDGQVG